MEHSDKHTPHLAHHFGDMEQQRESAKLGMWIFLLTEILLFGGLFTAYAIYRAWNPDMFYNAHKHLNIYLGSINTIVLISSSLTMALSIRSMQLNNRKRTMIFLIATLLMAELLARRIGPDAHRAWMDAAGPLPKSDDPLVAVVAARK